MPKTKFDFLTLIAISAFSFMLDTVALALCVRKIK